MTRSNVVLARQSQMKLPDHHQPLYHCPATSYHSPLPLLPSSASPSHSSASDLHSSPENFVHSYPPSFAHDHHQVHFVKDEHLSLPNLIPSSVKGAPAHLRPAIRKRQNSESAKRSRQRRKEAAKQFYSKFDEQCQRLTALESKVAKLIELVQEADDDAPAARPKQEHEIIADSLASSSEPPAAPTPTPTPTPAPAPAPAPAAHQHERQPSPLVQDMTVLSDEDERAGVPFEEDLEALFETCVHSQAMFGVC